MPRAKATRVACPFVVAVDIREQAPFAFRGIIGGRKDRGKIVDVTTRACNLNAGDYSIWQPDYLDKIAIERKSFPDFIGTLIRGRDRFIRELERLRSYESSHVVVETDWRTIIDHAHQHTKAPASALFRSVMSFSIEYPTKWHFCGDRIMAERACFRLLSKFFEMKK